MIKFSKKAISIISFSSAVIIATTTVLTNFLLKKEIIISKKHYPLERNNNYHQFPLSKIMANEKENLDKIINFSQINNNIVYFIDEEKFLKKIKLVIRNTLKNTHPFSKNYLEYIVECHYEIKNKFSVFVDLVWYIQENKIKYFDQFEIFLNK